jgi:peptide chain release factor 1
MTDTLAAMLAEYAELETRLADPSVHADQGTARQLGRRYAQLGPIVTTARELAAEDPSFAAEAATLEGRIGELEERLTELLLPRDPHDDSDVILEIKAGEGGEESALFAGDLLRMYLRYAERRGWKTEILDGNPSDLGGYKDVAVAVKGRGDDPVYARL